MISKFSVKKPYTVLVGVVLAIVLGAVSFTRMTTDLLPNISLPYVVVMTTYAGASPETVEAEVTQAVEASMATVSNIESIQSVSSENYSMVILEFSQSTNMDSVSLEIRENLDQISSYWSDSISNPIIMKLNPDMLPVMIAAVGVEGMEVGEVSTYVQDSLVPELESLEGVASVSATGLLEESVNVIISQEKVDAVNEKIFAAIDAQMADAEQELADGRQQLIDSRKELADGRQELVDHQEELSKGQAEIEEGKAALEQQKDSVFSQLAQTKNMLLSYKTELEATKAALNTGTSVAPGLAEGLETAGAEMDVINGVAQEYERITSSVSSGDVSSGDVSGNDAGGGITEAERSRLKELKNTFFSLRTIQQIRDQAGTSGNDDSSGLGSMVERLWELDWEKPENFAQVRTLLGTVSSGIAAQQQVQSSLSGILGNMNTEEYQQTVSQLTGQLDAALATVDQGLIEIEKGQMSASLELANAYTQLLLGEYQLQLAQTQMESALAQLDGSEQQLEEAEKQIDDGEKQLKEAKDSAYESADMKEILTVDMVNNLLTAQNFSMPAGYVTEEGIDYLVRVGDKPSTVEELQKLPLMDLHMDEVPIVTLGDVADVFYTDNSDAIYANVNGSPGVMLTIQKQTGYSTGEVSDRLLERFSRLMEEDSDLSLITLMDQGVYIDLVMDSIINNILFGGLLAILILILFLKDLRPTLVVACSIPISLVTAVVCMYFSGVTLNVISLSGLALGIGMLVDNSIVVIENIYRMRGEGLPVKEAAIEGSREVAGAIMASTLTTICVFLPIVFTEGITRQLFVDMGLTIAYSLLASLFIALTVVPAMSSKLLVKSKEQKEGRFFQAFVNVYSRLLALCLKMKPLVLFLVTALLMGSAAAALSRGTAFMPDMDSTQMTVNVSLEEGTPLTETAAVTDQVVERIMEIDEIQDVGAMTSGSSMSLLTGGGGGSTTSATIYVTTREDKTTSNEDLAALIQERTSDLDAAITVDTSSMDMSALGGSGISIQVQGRELDVIRQIAAEVAAIVADVEGTENVSDGLEDSDEELRIIVDREKAVEYGLTVAQVFTQIYSRLADAVSATTLVSADKDYNIYVMDGADTALTRELLRSFEITGTDQDGESVSIPLEEIAQFQDTQALNSISRSDQNRYVSVSASIADGYNVGIVSARLEEALEDYEVPDGYKLVFAGENETINDAMEQVILMLLLALVFMYLIMVAQFQSLLSPFIIMFTIPLAFTGGFLGLFISGSEVSVIAMIGFVMLSGIIVNNGIVLIDYMNQLREEGMEKREAILTAGRTRLRPVLMTALTTILALSTMVFSHDMGSEMAKPMAIVTIGGLLYGTLLTLIVIPCVYDYFIREKKEKKVKEKKSREKFRLRKK